MKLTAPLKSWNDNQGNAMYRLGDLPIDTKFRLEPTGTLYEPANYPRSMHTGKRQIRNLKTGQVEYHNCTKKVYVFSGDSEK